MNIITASGCVTTAIVQVPSSAARDALETRFGANRAAFRYMPTCHSMPFKSGMGSSLKGPI